MDQVDFEPAPHWTATILKADGYHSDSNSQTRCVAYLLFQGQISLNFGERFSTADVPCLFA